MVAVVGIISRRNLTIEAHHRNQLGKSNLALCKLLCTFTLTVIYKQLYKSNKMGSISVVNKLGYRYCMAQAQADKCSCVGHEQLMSNLSVKHL